MTPEAGAGRQPWRVPAWAEMITSRSRLNNRRRRDPGVAWLFALCVFTRE